MKYWIGLIIFGIITALTAYIYHIGHSFIGGAINGAVYAGVWYLAQSDVKVTKS